MAKLPKILLACTPVGHDIVQPAFAQRAELLSATTMAEALSLLNPDLDLIVCQMHFDDSRMFDLLRAAKQTAPDVPFVACRLIGSVLSRAMMEAMMVGAKHAGAETFLDIEVMQQRYGANYRIEFANEAMRYCRRRS